MATALVVTQPFADYAKGDRITDPAVVKDLMTHHHHRVVKIVVPDPAPVHEAAAPQPEPPAAAKPTEQK